MRTLVILAIGLAVMLLFLVVAHFVNKSRGAGFVDGGKLFIWFWLVATLLNGAYGFFAHGVSLLVEIAVFAILFGVPAGAAWYLSRLIRRRHAPPS
ncbi:MAG: hypothetical protein ACK4NA_07730 [Alphaproteobacteria bacterium]